MTDELKTMPKLMSVQQGPHWPLIFLLLAGLLLVGLAFFEGYGVIARFYARQLKSTQRPIDLAEPSTTSEKALGQLAQISSLAGEGPWRTAFRWIFLTGVALCLVAAVVAAIM